MSEFLHSVQIKQKECVQCGTQEDLDYDHYLPKCLIGPARMRQKVASSHPLYDVIRSGFNKFPMCRQDHEMIDNLKSTAFLNSALRNKGNLLNNLYRGDPAALMLCLADHYPITQNREIFITQVKCMTITNNLFIDAVLSLNGQFPRILELAYFQAAEYAIEFNKKLMSLKPPTFSIVSNFQATA